MRCRYCNIALAPSRSFIDGEFCCNAHRVAHAEAVAPEEPADISAMARVTKTVSDGFEMLRRRFVFRSATPAEPELALAYEISEDAAELGSTAAEPADAHQAEAHQAEAHQSDAYQAEAYQDESQEPESAPESGDEAEGSHPNPARETATSSRWLTTAWKRAPRDLKLISVLLPILLVIALSGSVPKVPIEHLAPQSLGQAQVQFEKVVQDRWKNLNENISDRAAVAYSDDFRSGLDAWDSRANLTRTWSYDATGFVRPGPLAIFKPTVDLSDYRFEFLGEIDQKAMGWAFRAQDLDNYYAMKFVVVKPGPLPIVHMVRYAVIHGKEGPHIDKPLPLNVRTDMLYRVQVNAQGGDFTIMAQGQVVDFWSDQRLQRGGIGFFCNRGERARLRWVEVSHQYDALGRLCAYLAPYGIEGRNGDIN
jgi:hypothetical protein